nr:ATP-binding protein [Streptomyces sp. Caat 7-52]
MTCVASRAVSRHPPSAGPGWRVRVGDGSRGWAPTVPYDRVIAAYAVERIPWAWVAKRYEKGSIILTSNKTFSEWGRRSATRCWPPSPPSLRSDLHQRS